MSSDVGHERGLDQPAADPAPAVPPQATRAAEAEPSARSLGRRVADQARQFGPGLGGYIAVRAIGLILLALWAAPRDHLRGLLSHQADAFWYVRIAQHGYDSGHGQSDMAFFPLFPMLVRATHAIAPISVWSCAVGVAWLGSLLAAAGLYKIGAHLFDRRTGILLAVLWGALPHGIVESLAYTEPLTTAFAAWALYALLTRRWISAGLFCILAGLTAPVANGLVAVVGLAALIAIVKRRDGWRPWAAAILAPLGWFGYLAWVGAQTGHIDGWFRIQKTWGATWDFGGYTASMFGRLVEKPQPIDYALVALVLVAGVALVILMIIDRLPWPLVVHSALVVMTSIGTNGYFNAKARFLISAFGLLIPIAVSLAKAMPAKMWTVLATLTVISAWCGGYLLLAWPYSP